MIRPITRVAAPALLVAAIIASLVLVTDADAGQSAQTSRLAGPSRIDTAVAVAQRAFPDGATTAYLARSDDPADATVGGTLTDGPILLVPSCGPLPAVVEEELQRLAPGEVIALGGAAAVCDDLLQAAGAAATGTAPPGEVPDGQEPVEVAVDLDFTQDGQPVDAAALPFTVEVTDPGVVEEGDTTAHQLVITAHEELSFHDLRYHGVVTSEDGQLVVTDDRSDPDHRGGRTQIIVEDSLTTTALAAGGSTSLPLTLHTSDDEVGPVPLTPGAYTLEVPLAWTPADGDVRNTVTLLATYAVSSR